MSKRGYGNVKPRFAKYFARHKNSAGAHDPKNAKQQAQSEQAIEDMRESLDELYEAGPRCADVFDKINTYEEKELMELAARWQDAREIYDVGERVEIVSEGPHQNETARIVLRRQDKGDFSYGVVFDYDMNMHTVYFTGKDFERV